MIRMPVWSAYLEILNKYAFVREFILKNDFDRINVAPTRPRRRRTKCSRLFEIDPFLAMKENYLQTIAYYDALPPEALMQPMNRLNMSVSLNNLAWLLVTYPDSKRHEPEAAVRYARRAVELCTRQAETTGTRSV